jgi:hypothetical protein
MTAILRACLAYWPVTILGLLGTGAFIFWSGHPTPVYFSQTDVIFLAPISLRNPNSLMISSDSLTSMAGIVQREIDQANVAARTSGTTVTLVDQGIYHGIRVKVPDYGGQWQHKYDQPVLDLQVTGSDPDEVSQRALAARKQIVKLIEQRQEHAGVAQRNLIRVEMLPASPSVDLVSGRRIRAIGLSGLLGVSATFAVCAVISKLHFLIRNRRKLDEMMPIRASDAALVGAGSESANSADSSQVQ